MTAKEKNSGMTDPEIAVELSGVDKWFSILQVLHDVNLTVRRGEKVVVCGPSGSGKSTMIRCINYLEKHQKGRIVVNGTELTDNRKVIDRVRQDVGMVFQNFNLYPHLTVLENCMLAPVGLRALRERMPRPWREPIWSGCGFPIRRISIQASCPAGSSSERR